MRPRAHRWPTAAAPPDDGVWPRSPLPSRASTRSRRVIWPLVATLALLVAGGCGAGHSAEEWAREVCATLVPWRLEITELNGRAQQQIAAARTAEETRQGLLELLSGAEAATESARVKLVAAGAPDVAGGEEVANGFIRSLERARDAYARAAADLQALPTADETAFYDGVVPVLDRLTQEYAAAGVETAELESAELRAAFDEVEQCR